MNKKMLTAVLAGVLSMGTLAGCQSASTNAKLKITASIYPEYEWVNAVLGDEKENADVTLLMKDGVDLHSYQPSAEDILTIKNSDLFLYVGGESDGWAVDASKEAKNKDFAAINLMELLQDITKQEVAKEGMQKDEDEDDGEIEYDEHVWLSLRNAEKSVQGIADDLASMQPEHADEYQANAKAYIGQLDALDQRYQKTVDSAKTKVLVFGDRFPFRYMVDDYGLDYYAAFVGCSAETEASFETIRFLADKIDTYGLKHILTIESSDQKIANTIKCNTASKDQDILTLDSIQSVDEKKMQSSYMDIMTDNLNVLAKALDTEPAK
ncbi:MAG: metal ABC transporter substrate-binding protein [Solobacterium sp.]|nr:metal ABC transporter substrate-binding protein [Solobacterium sp.]MCH4205963.1 metal ABC transporter substrate-binding protein [Solobacterium sp.]MCH4227429.1 metal ABC transporter substrate-binding protein [Solobacterium sp.]MCH4282798.1 metal ABC transporter substrate-binding protein [Solobacterium sp.]